MPWETTVFYICIHMKLRYALVSSALAAHCLLASCCSIDNRAGPPRNSPSDSSALAEDSAAPRESGAAEPAVPGLGHKLLWYIPNRVLDLADIFRFRLRAGPGIAANVRVTERANLFAGRYNTIYIGLPGPRMAPALRSPVGLERERGLIVMGVDATDDMDHEPGYSPTEFNVGLQALLLGGEVGLDPVELGDFLAGFVMIDLREDDH